MNIVTPFIPKDNQAIPDGYGMEIVYVNGKTESFYGTHRLVDTCHSNKLFVGVATSPFFEIWTKEDEMVFIPVSSVQRIKFDKDWSKTVEIRNKIERERNAGNK